MQQTEPAIRRADLFSLTSSMFLIKCGFPLWNILCLKFESLCVAHVLSCPVCLCGLLVFTSIHV